MEAPSTTGSGLSVIASKGRFKSKEAHFAVFKRQLFNQSCLNRECNYIWYGTNMRSCWWDIGRYIYIYIFFFCMFV